MQKDEHTVLGFCVLKTVRLPFAETVQRRFKLFEQKCQAALFSDYNICLSENIIHMQIVLIEIGLGVYVTFKVNVCIKLNTLFQSHLQL